MQEPMIQQNDQVTLLIRAAVGGFLAALVQGRAPARDPLFTKLWKGTWGPNAHGDRVSRETVLSQTAARKRLLQSVFQAASQAVSEVGIVADDVPGLKESLRDVRRRLRPSGRCLAGAVDAALARLVLSHRRPIGSITVCYSAFGDVAEVARTYALELKDILGGISMELHIIACAGLKTTIPDLPAVSGVSIRIRNITLRELVQFPGIKAPGLIAACADAVAEGIDMVVTIDADARLPLFEILPAVAALVESEEIDAALGSRRVPGAWVAKPGLRHLSSWINSIYVNTVMGPVLGPHVHDPQAIFRVYRGVRLSHALERLGWGKSGMQLNDLQDGSLACELMLLAHLRDDGFPHLDEIPAIETMTYPANPAAMPIMSSTNVKAMLAAANRLRHSVRGRPLLAEGSESLVLMDAEGAVIKFPRFPERLGEKKLLPTSLVADNYPLDIALSLPGPFRTLFLALASRRHPDRGFGLSSSVTDAMADTRPEVRESLPKRGHWAFHQHAFRLPLGAALVSMSGWLVDRWLLKCGDLVEHVGMLPRVMIHWIGGGLRIVRFWSRILRACIRPVLRRAARFLIRALRVWAAVRTLSKAALRRTLYVLELAGALRVFATVDLLDQRSRIFRCLIHAVMRFFVEIQWLLESVNVCVDLKRPILCTVQPTPVRPVAQVLTGLPASMTAELEEVLRLALERYRSLGEQGYLDGEFSTDNLAFELTDNDVRVVLVDLGALVSARTVPPDVLAEWLSTIQAHYARSYQLYKLRNGASGSAEQRRIIGDFVGNTRSLIDQWKHQTESDYEKRNIRNALNLDLSARASRFVGMAMAR